MHKQNIGVTPLYSLACDLAFFNIELNRSVSFPVFEILCGMKFQSFQYAIFDNSPVDLTKEDLKIVTNN